MAGNTQWQRWFRRPHQGHRVTPRRLDRGEGDNPAIAERQAEVRLRLYCSGAAAERHHHLIQSAGKSGIVERVQTVEPDMEQRRQPPVGSPLPQVPGGGHIGGARPADDMLRASGLRPDRPVPRGADPAAERAATAIGDQQLGGDAFQAAGIEHGGPHRQIGGERGGQRFIGPGHGGGDRQAARLRQAGRKPRLPAAAIGADRLFDKDLARGGQVDVQRRAACQQGLCNHDVRSGGERAIAKADPLLHQHRINR